MIDWRVAYKAARHFHTSKSFLGFIQLFGKYVLLVAVTLSFFAIPLCVAQSNPAAPPPPDAKILRPEAAIEVDREDLTSASVDKSSLHALPPRAYRMSADNTLELVQVQWRQGDPISLFISRPKGVEKPPVILYLYDYRYDSARFESPKFQQLSTQNGFASVGFVSALSGQRYHSRPLKEWFVSELQESLATSAHDIQMILNYLSARGDFDMDRVGMFAQGSGASIAILASGADPRIKVLDVVDPWADWPVWLATSPVVPADERAQYVRPEFLEKVAPLDPLTWLPKVQAKKVRMEESMFTKSTPAPVKDKLREGMTSLQERGTVVIYQTPADTKDISVGSKDVEWTEQELRSLFTPESEGKLAQGAGQSLNKN